MMEDIKLEKFAEWLYDRYSGKLSFEYGPEDCFILADMADVLITMKETNNERLDEIFGLPLKREVKCGMRCRRNARSTSNGSGSA